MIEKIAKNIYTELIKSLVETGLFSYNKDGVNIEAKQDDNSLSISCSYTEQDNSLKDKFINFADSLTDAFFQEICDTYLIDQLKKIDELINSGNPVNVLNGAEDFISKAKFIAKNKIAEIDEKILSLTSERNSYVDVLNFNL